MAGRYLFKLAILMFDNGNLVGGLMDINFQSQLHICYW